MDDLGNCWESELLVFLVLSQKYHIKLLPMRIHFSSLKLHDGGPGFTLGKFFINLMVKWAILYTF